MSGLISAKSLQFAPMSPASFFCSGRSVLLPDAEAPLVLITTGRSWRGSSPIAFPLGGALAACGSMARPTASLAERVAGDVPGQRDDQLAGAPGVAVRGEQCRQHARQRAVCEPPATGRPARPRGARNPRSRRAPSPRSAGTRRAAALRAIAPNSPRTAARRGAACATRSRRQGRGQRRSDGPDTLARAPARRPARWHSMLGVE